MSEATEKTISDGVNEAFSKAWDKQNPPSEPTAEAKSVVKSDTSPEKGVDREPVEAEDTPTGDNPSQTSAKQVATLAMARQKIKRAGLADESINGKSDAYILDLANECDTLHRQDDREYSERQKQEREAEGQSPGEADPEESMQATDTGSDEESATSAIPNVDFTPLVEEFGDEAARPVIDALEQLQSANAKLTARLDAQEQERHLAPVLKQAHEVMDGMESTYSALSKPESRQALIADADKLAIQFKDKYDLLPTKEERVQAVLTDAARVRFGGEGSAGDGTPAKTRRKAEPAAANSNDVPVASPGSMNESINRAFNKAWTKQMGSKR
jgi:hypothetical protein